MWPCATSQTVFMIVVTIFLTHLSLLLLFAIIMNHVSVGLTILTTKQIHQMEKFFL